ncbi:hypothetical protein [Pseudobacteriovorax antillogorgiicola]|nr:hypothetical protein [Pseudobacteriovorax antillogorgiicola]
MTKIFAILLLLMSFSASATPFKIGVYSEYPFSNGVEARFGILPTPVEIKIKVGALAPGYIMGGSEALLEANRINVEQAIIFDNAYEEGFHFEISLGSKIPKISRQLYFDFGYAMIRGDGHLPPADTLSLISHGRPVRNLGPSKENYELGLKGDIHFFQGSLGYLIPINKVIDIKAELSLKHGFHSSIEAEYGPRLYKDALSKRFDEAQKDALNSVPVLPSVTVGVNYGIDL